MNPVLWLVSIRNVLNWADLTIALNITSVKRMVAIRVLTLGMILRSTVTRVPIPVFWVLIWFPVKYLAVWPSL